MDWFKLSLLKLQGVQGIDIMFDGDEAGQKATEQIKTIFRKDGTISSKSKTTRWIRPRWVKS